jgi:hypothetical protein
MEKKALLKLSVCDALYILKLKSQRSQKESVSKELIRNNFKIQEFPHLSKLLLSFDNNSYKLVKEVIIT